MMKATKRPPIGLLRKALFECWIGLRDYDTVTPQWKRNALKLAEKAWNESAVGFCTCELKIHQRRLKSRHPVRPVYFTFGELMDLQNTLDDARDVYRRRIRKLKRCHDRTLLLKALKRINRMRREAQRS